nr:lysophospholipid acyltransferase family protein [Corynebacterium aquatimens]
MSLQGVKYYIHGSEHIPTSGGVLMAANHTGYYDFVAGALPGLVRGRRPVRYMAKKELWDDPFTRWISNGGKQIPVDRSRGAASIDAAVESLKNGEYVGIFPDGTLSRSFELSDWKSGAARIAQKADVPLVPCAIWGSQRIWTKGRKKELGRTGYPIIVNVGPPVPTDGTPEEATARLVDAVQQLLDEARQMYSDKFGPFEPGLDWMPASMGGSAPTPEEARELNRREKEERERKKAQK